nr:MAG TPA: hypothetical protein [Caudoviricetes sp.]
MQGRTSVHVAAHQLMDNYSIPSTFQYICGV